MSETTPNLGIPTMDANILQPSIPFNTAMQLLDAVAQLVIIDTLSAPPATSVADVGKVYLIGDLPTGVWAGRAGQLALCTAPSLWIFITPKMGWSADIAGRPSRLGQSGWVPLGGSSPANAAVKVTAEHGASTQLQVAEELITLTGASVSATIFIPNRAILLGVSCRTVSAITGAASYACGIAGETSKFGSLLSISAGSTNMGVIGPQAFYADTAVVLTSAGGDFTAGSVRIALHYLANAPAAS
ncbi:DUF2793 domain-containing protein [Xanthomonas oryzae]|uniref:DUF2793 domain-containing protein n=1 Tax=Xanthomonas oryzae TaxID=347 RepID=UPI0006556E98|nr:DUF2793 domain-containing protein [Xanthomonas oryzae]AKO18955.1 hypothetical protein ACU11_05195 [Xanthomonas oryzae pv. oryzicola]PUE93389.1 DUF2793 domain-containing protein [Xanthomonas oryzae pv. oryzicola]